MSSSHFLKASKRALPPVLYSDRGCIILQKPPGLVCQLNHSGEERYLRNDFNALLKELGQSFGEEPVPVHRLDKGTTGALIFGRSVARARALSQQFQARTMEKTYLALVRGGEKTFPDQHGEIKAAIQYEDGRASISLSPDAKPSITEWEVVGSSALMPLSLLRLHLHTGHKHQLRIHLAKCLGAPILGDSLYSKKPITKAVRDVCDIPGDRIFLHASHLSFFNYRPGGPKKRFRLGVTAPLPDDFLKICHAAGIKIDVAESKGGLWVDDMPVVNGRVPEVEGTWLPNL